MNRLWVRLSFVFSIVILLGIVVITSAALFIVQNGIAQGQFEELSMEGGWIDRLADYYREQDSWDDVIVYLNDNGFLFTSNPQIGFIVELADAGGNILYSPMFHDIGQTRSFAELQDALPIAVDGRVRGYLIVQQTIPPEEPRPLFYTRLSGGLVFIGLLASIIGVAAGVLMSRSLTAPLSRLVQAARAIGARNLSLRVREEGTTEVRELAYAFNEMVSALDEAETLRRSLVADVAHELRTPLSVLQGNLSAILEDVYPLDKAEIARLYDQTRLLSRLVNDLHELSQAEAKQLPLNLQEVNFVKVVEDTAMTFKSLAEVSGVTLTIDIPESAVYVYGDSGRLAQIVSNLLMNALAHTPAEASIHVELKTSAESAKLTVSDSGEGISPQHLPYIFARFYRVDRARARNTGGVGLGLAIVKALVEAHKGVVQVFSEGRPGEGTAFTVTLPLTNPS